MARRNVHWPEDLVTKILLRLPVKSIIRFKCVTKTWSSLFENFSFVSQHLSISKEVNNRLLVYHYDDNDNKVVIRLFLDQTLFSYQDLLQQIPQDFGYRYPAVCVHDGLLCLCDTINSRISLWNPATRKFKLLPECNENIPPKADTCIHTIGFGSDKFLNDYKVIYIRDYVDFETDIPGPTHYAVYRMSTNSWRVFKEEDVELFEDWPAIPESESIGQLLPLHGDRISLCVPQSDVTSRSYDIWVLNEERHFWTKLLRIGPISGVKRMFGFWNLNGNKVYVESASGQLLLYDLDSQKFRDIGIKTRRALDLLKVYTYEESLIATNRGKID